MTTQVEYDDVRVWGPKLIEWAERGRRHYYQEAQSQQRRGNPRNAAGYLEAADRLALVADRARVRLVDLSELTLAELDDAEPEPPQQLVPFVDWLKLRFGALLPGLSVETWQAIGCLILMARGIRP